MILWERTDADDSCQEQPFYLYTQPVDMRKQINGLVNLLVDSFEQNPQEGGLFVFTNANPSKTEDFILG